MKRIYALVVSLLLILSITLSVASCNKVYDNYSEDVTTYTLDEGGQFKILTVADLHFMNDNSDRDNNMLDRLGTLINHAEPDLLVVLGDMVYSDTNRVEALDVIVDEIDAYEIPWACVYGNHDPENPEGINGTTKEEAVANKLAMNEVLLDSEYCLFKVGPNDIEGSGNYIINITDYNNKIIQTLFFLDSGDYIRRDDVDDHDFIPSTALGYTKNYGTIYPNQIDWYEDTVNDISEFTYKGKEVVPSLAFFHIPLPEYRTVWELYLEESSEVTHYDGSLEENELFENGGVCSPSFNTGMFDKMVELGSTKAVFVGHDHANDFSIEYKGIRLNYNGGMRHITYTVPLDIVESMFGGRLVTINEDGTTSYERLLISQIEDTPQE